MIGNPLFDLESNLPDELFGTSGGPWGTATATVTQPISQQPQQAQQQPCVQRPPSMGAQNAGMGMQMGLGPGAQQQQQNGTMDSQHHHQLPHMGMQNKASMNAMSGGAISGSAMGSNNMNMANSGMNKAGLANKLNSPPGTGPMGMMNSMGNGPQMMSNMPQQQQQQQMNSMLNQGGMSVQMKTSMMNAGQMGQAMHNGPQSMMGNARPVGVMQNAMMQQQQQQQPAIRGQMMQGMNQGPRLPVSSRAKFIRQRLDLNLLGFQSKTGPRHGRNGRHGTERRSRRQRDGQCELRLCECQHAEQHDDQPAAAEADRTCERRHAVHAEPDAAAAAEVQQRAGHESEHADTARHDARRSDDGLAAHGLDRPVAGHADAPRGGATATTAAVAAVRARRTRIPPERQLGGASERERRPNGGGRSVGDVGRGRSGSGERGGHRGPREEEAHPAATGAPSACSQMPTKGDAGQRRGATGERGQPDDSRSNPSIPF